MERERGRILASSIFLNLLQTNFNAIQDIHGDMHSSDGRGHDERAGIGDEQGNTHLGSERERVLGGGRAAESESGKQPGEWPGIDAGAAGGEKRSIAGYIHGW